MILNIDKSNWVLTKLGEIAFDINDRIDNPSTSGYNRFVGLEHFVSGDLKIKNWGTTENLVSAMKKFKAGDVLFARRNAHLRRASMVDFDGVCSGDAFVLRENHNNIVRGFLAFILNTDTLWDYAIANAAGTMSKRVKWRDLANYEFLFPPKAQQAKIAELLWAADENEERLLKLKEIFLILSYSLLRDELKKLNGKTRPLSAVLIEKKLRSQPPHNYDKYLGLENIEPATLYSSDYQDSSNVQAQCAVIKTGDLCYSKLRPYLDKAFIATFDCVASTEVLVFDTVNGISKEYILYTLHSREFINYVSDQGFGTKMPRVNQKIIGDYRIKILSNSDQKKLLEKLQEIEKQKNIVIEFLSNSRLLKSQLINNSPYAIIFISDFLIFRIS